MNPLNEHIHPTSNSLTNFFESITKKEEGYLMKYDLAIIKNCIVLLRKIESVRQRIKNKDETIIENNPFGY